MCVRDPSVNSQEGPPHLRYAPNVYLPHMVMGQAHSAFLYLLPVSLWLLYVLTLRTSVKLNFRRLSIVIVL